VAGTATARVEHTDTARITDRRKGEEKALICIGKDLLEKTDSKQRVPQTGYVRYNQCTKKGKNGPVPLSFWAKAC
jgi:hypothetical protein